MADYTIELRTILASGYDIFRFPYEFYDPKQKHRFEESFIRHFYFREIGCETVDRFIWYLEDKMKTVFPYYNELFKTTLMEYNILENAYMTETTTITRDTLGTTNGVSSTVGRISDQQQTDISDARSTETSSSSETDSTITKQEAGSTSETKNGTATTEGTVTETTATETESTDTRSDLKKFLDTPQGAVDLSDNSYVTNVNQDSTNGTGHSETDGTKTTETDTTVTTADTSEGSSERSETTTDHGTTSGTGSESVEGTSATTHTGEQVSNSDNNTRAESVGKMIEKTEYNRHGNVGVDTDSDAIFKHMKLQKVLKQIELLFFEECEDLFMQVY